MESKGIVLLVDDEEVLIKHLRMQLERLSYTVHTALFAKEALDVLSKNEIDVLVADIRMPGMDGIELMQEAMKCTPDIQCIIITGHGTIDNAIEAMRYGAINYLRKPDEINADILDVAIQKGMEKLELIRSERRYRKELETANAELTGHRKHLEELVEKEIARRKKTESKLKERARRELLVIVMNLSLNYWNLTTQKTKMDLAEESKLWTVSREKDGLSTKTLDKYLRIEKLPSNPRYNIGVETGYFVLSYPAIHPYPELKEKLKKQLEELEMLFL